MLTDTPAKDFTESIDLYTEAIQLNPKDATFWHNRAMSKGKMEEHGSAIADASELPWRW
jgi:serine/threonine-protein phosphatase 5